jgi:ABC-type branched-subunit amino acid transport system substrate-binding protein
MLSRTRISLVFILLLASCINFPVNWQKSAKAPSPIITDQTEPIVTTPNAERVGDLRYQNLKFNSKEEIKIAVMLPLSGSHAKLGKAMFEAMELALFDQANSRIVLVPFDTKANEFEAISAMDEIIANDIRVVVGPVFSKVIKAIAPIAKMNNITIISFSNDLSLAEDGVLLMSVDYRDKVSHLLNYSFKQGINYYAVIAPGNQYGADVVKEVRKIVDLNKGLVMKSEFYLSSDKLPTNVKRALRALKEIPTDEEGNPLFAARVKGKEVELDEFGNKKYRDIAKFKRALIVVAEDKALSQIASILSYTDIMEQNIKLLSVRAFDPANITNKAILKDMLYVDVANDNQEVFNAHFQKIYNHEPLRIASLAYDALSTVITVASFSEDPDFSQISFKQKNGFAGVNGVFRFRESGVSERLLNVMELSNEVPKIVSEAPLNFIEVDIVNEFIENAVEKKPVE